MCRLPVTFGGGIITHQAQPRRGARQSRRSSPRGRIDGPRNRQADRSSPASSSRNRFREIGLVRQQAERHPSEASHSGSDRSDARSSSRLTMRSTIGGMWVSIHVWSIGRSVSSTWPLAGLTARFGPRRVRVRRSALARPGPDGSLCPARPPCRQGRGCRPRARPRPPPAPAQLPVKRHRPCSAHGPRPRRRSGRWTRGSAASKGLCWASDWSWTRADGRLTFRWRKPRAIGPRLPPRGPEFRRRRSLWAPC